MAGKECTKHTDSDSKGKETQAGEHVADEIWSAGADQRGGLAVVFVVVGGVGETIGAVAAGV